MYFCEECRLENGWQESMSRSAGRCEMCEKGAICYDVPSKYLKRPEPKPLSPIDWFKSDD